MNVLEPFDKAYSFAICQLHASDGDLSHTIIIVDKWIFDSNFSQALPLSKVSLDKCCSLGNYRTNITFQKSVKTYRYIYRCRKRKMNKNME